MTDQIAMTQFDAPLTIPELRVKPEWIDYNGHMNVAYYVAAFDQGVDYFLHAIELGERSATSGGGSSFTLELHVNYLREVHENNPLRITCQLLDYDKKRFHYFLEMYHATDGYLAAVSEQIGIYIDLNTRRPASMPEVTLGLLQTMRDSHRHLPVPAKAGSRIGIRRKAT